MKLSNESLPSIGETYCHWPPVLLFIVIATTTHAVEIEQVEFENMLQHPQEHWYNLTLMGVKTGYVHTYLEKAGYQGEMMIRNRTDLVIHFKAGRANLKIETTRIEYTDSDLMPRYFFSTSNESGLKQVEGKISDGVAYISTTLNGETTESEVTVPSGTVSETIAVNYLVSENRMKIGDKQSFHVFSFDFLQPVKTELHVVSEETITYQMQEEPVCLLALTMDIMGGITTRMWITSDGTTYQTATDMMGFSLMATKTDRATALDGIEEVDVILGTRILPIGEKPKSKASRLVANVKLTTGRIAETILTNARQKLEVASEQAGTLSIDVPTVDVEDCPTLPIQHRELQPFLSSSVYIQADHPDIRAKALEVLEGEVNSWRAAEKLCRWVYTSITEKNLSGGYGSSLTALESLSGDCTEHTVLLIALARSVGIPSRICSGLVFARDAFYYHFWPEVYVGTWIPMEPTLGQVIADANHIQLGGSALESDTMIELTEGVFRTLNQLEIAVIE